MGNEVAKSSDFLSSAAVCTKNGNNFFVSSNSSKLFGRCDGLILSVVGAFVSRFCT